MKYTTKDIRTIKDDTQQLRIDTNGLILDTNQLLDSVAQAYPSFWETWILGIRATTYHVTNPVTGVAWAVSVADSYSPMAVSSPNASENCRLVTQGPFAVPGNTDNYIFKSMTLEFEIMIATVANIDNAVTFFGMSPAVDSDRTTNNILGWCLASDVLQAIYDGAGSEALTACAVDWAATDPHKLRIDINGLSTGIETKFTVDGVLKATKTSNFLTKPFYLNFYVATEAGGASSVKLGMIHLWLRDYLI